VPARRGATLGAVLAALVAAACGGHAIQGAGSASGAPGEVPAPPRPAVCDEVPAGGALTAWLAAAPTGAAACLGAGVHPGPLRVGAGVILWGPREAVIRSSGEGTTVRLAAGAALLGVSVDGSGGRFDQLDAAVHVEGAGTRVEGVQVRNAIHGILVEKAQGVRVRGNVVYGDRGQSLGLRGDPIRLWETRDSVVEDNRVQDGRDVVVWYSGGNRLRRNQVTGGRYGTHLMYSHGNHIEENRYQDNVVGIFLMYSRDAEVRGNLLAGSSGSAGIGLGLKEAGNVRAAGNLLLHDTVGVYLDTSPLDPADHNVFEDNTFLFCEVGVVMHGSERRNLFRDNDFRELQGLARVEGRSDPRGVTWTANHFDEYAGYDLDADGFGDVPYEFRSIDSLLAGTHPELAFFRGTPALLLAEAITRIVPLFEPRALAVDPRPRMRARSRSDAH
jgi:nitrous oxidase accessory protein